MNILQKCIDNYERNNEQGRLPKNNNTTNANEMMNMRERKRQGLDHFQNEYFKLVDE